MKIDYFDNEQGDYTIEVNEVPVMFVKSESLAKACVNALRHAWQKEIDKVLRPALFMKAQELAEEIKKKTTAIVSGQIKIVIAKENVV